MSLVEKALQKIQSQQAKLVLEAAERSRAVSPTTPYARSGEPSVVLPSSAAILQPLAPPRPFVPTGHTVEVDMNSLRRAGILPTVEYEREVARQLRVVKHGLLRKMASDPLSPETVGRTVMVTSGLPGDGKTFTAVNLAISLALEKDLRVVLVDTDIPKPHITTMFGLAGQRGLIDVLSEPEADVAQIVHGTSVKGLYFVPAGRGSEIATELLSSGRMSNVIRHLAGLESNMLVLFDSPPLLITSESQVLAAAMSQIILVVKCGVTPQSVVKQALEVLAAGTGQVSLVFNDARSSDRAAYGYGYEYGYGQRPNQNNPGAAGGRE